jgi:hypothetical protein
MRDAPLFRDGRLSDYLRGHQTTAVGKVTMVSPDEVRLAPEAVVARIFEEHCPETVSFDWEGVTRTEPREDVEVIEQWGERYTVPIDVISIVVPMSGDPELLKRQADTFSMGRQLEAFVRGDALVFSVRGRGLTPDAVIGQVDQMKRALEEQVSWANNQVASWMPHLRIAIDTAVRERKERLDSAASLSAGLAIPLAPTSDSRRVAVPVARKALRLQDEKSGEASAKIEPVLADAIYEDVVRTLSGLGRALERLPNTASRFKEEEIRDLALFILNSNYEGAARGEVFNGTGKTDILLPWKDRNAFIGECKFWKGPKGFGEAIDQLMGYLVWQDTKAALILFIRSGEASSILEKADGVIREHASFKTARESVDPATRRDYVLVSASDTQRFIKLALLPVIIPSAE